MRTVSTAKPYRNTQTQWGNCGHLLQQLKMQKVQEKELDKYA